MIESRHILKSVTPKHGVTWVVKWLSTVLIVAGLAVWQIALPFSEAQTVAKAFLLLGGLGWWWTAYAWNDRALQLTTGVIGFILLMDILRSWL